MLPRPAPEVKIMRKILGVVTLAGLLITGSAAGASADPPDPKKVAPCPSGFQTMTIDEVLVIAAKGFGREVFEGADFNKDGKLCVRIQGENPRFEPVTFLFADNKLGIGRTVK
jgi:hypothetical protein